MSMSGSHHSCWAVLCFCHGLRESSALLGGSMEARLNLGLLLFEAVSSCPASFLEAC